MERIALARPRRPCSVTGRRVPAGQSGVNGRDALLNVVLDREPAPVPVSALMEKRAESVRATVL